MVLAGAGPIGKVLVQIKVLQPYQYRRIEAWLNPELDPEGKSFQVLQGLYAIGSGGLFGQGLGQSIQKLGFLPESQNDMIFAIICEELGLFGAVSIILIFLFMIFRFMVIANNAPDLFGARYAWIAGAAKQDDGSILVALTQDRDDDSATELLLYRLSGF